jgi:hypothetical protein
MPQAHTRSSQRAKRCWHCQIEQQLKKVGKELRHRHRVLTSLLNALRLRDEALGHASEAGDHEQCNAGDPI